MDSSIVIPILSKTNKQCNKLTKGKAILQFKYLGRASTQIGYTNKVEIIPEPGSIVKISLDINVFNMGLKHYGPFDLTKSTIINQRPLDPNFMTELLIDDIRLETSIHLFDGLIEIETEGSCDIIQTYQDHEN